jgi:exopolysaccharide biosynthesis polyprenyl glycosylphosphotransferase
MLRALRLLTPLLLAMDLALVALALTAADQLRLTLRYGMVLMQDARGYLTPQVYAAVIAAFGLAFFVSGSHQPRRLAEGGAWRRQLLAAMLGLPFFLAALFFLKIYDFSRLLVAYFFAMTVPLLLLRSAAASIALKRLVTPFARRALVIGGGDVGEEVARRLCSLPLTSLVGVIATDDKLSAFRNLGSLNDVSAIVREHDVDEVMIALPAEQHARVEDVVLKLQADPVRVHFVPDVLELAMVRATVQDFFGIPVVGIREPPIDPAGLLAKRAFDLAAGSVLTLLAAPFMLGCTLAIKLTDKGPVFFRQSRIGENGQPFRMLKFRSMVVDAEARLKDLGVDLSKLSRNNPVFKIQNDPRVTPVGRFMRRWSLDELPQLLNVLKGDMSLVGPRPEEAAVVARYSYFHRKRLAVKPGITGPMQVNGRGDLPIERRLNLELAYIEGWTLWSDVKILAKTVPTVLWGKGAY